MTLKTDAGRYVTNIAVKMNTLCQRIGVALTPDEPTNNKIVELQKIFRSIIGANGLIEKPRMLVCEIFVENS